MSDLEEKMLNILYRREKAILDGNSKNILSLLEPIINSEEKYRELLTEQKMGVNRLVVLLTHKCQLNCSYCSVRKYSESMRLKILFKAIDLLMTSKKNEVQLQFFGGEPLLEFELLKNGVSYAQKQAKSVNKKVIFLLTTNGIALAAECIAFLEKENVKLELSMDGIRELQLQNRTNVSGVDYYDKLKRNVRALVASKIEYITISVVAPDKIKEMLSTVKYLTELGVKNIQLNYNLGVYWDSAAKQEYKKAEKEVKKYLNKKGVVYINDTMSRREPVVLNAEITVDCNGDLFLETGICLENDFKKLKKDFYLGSLKNIKDINSIATSRLHNFKTLIKVYTKGRTEFRKIILNNIEMGGPAWIK
jgi:sulfatase maturation enzyme AslB (radical SAM superfamily)